MNKEDRGKKICFITVAHPMYGIGGAEMQTWYYAKEFATQGWEVTFLTYRNNKIVYAFNNDDITLISIKKFRFFLFNWINVFINLLILNCDYYFVRHHNFILGVCRAVCNITNKKLIWSTMHDRSCGLNPELNVRNGAMLRKFRWKLDNLLFNYGVKKSDLIIVQNQLQAQIVKRVHNKNSIIIYNSHPVPGILKSGEVKNRILFIAAMKEFKQPELFCQIASSFLTSEYEFEVIGENYQDIDKANSLIELMDQSRCSYLGFMPPDQVNEILRTSKILVNTSSSEGFPNTFVQAWINGIPVISLNVDPDDIIKKNKLGFCCNGDIGLMIEKIQYLMNDESQRNQISKNCKRFAADHLNLKVNVHKLSKILYRLYNISD